jgi:hypothetical protein
MFQELVRVPGGQRFPVRRIPRMPAVRAPLWVVVAWRTRPLIAGGRTGGRVPFFRRFVKLKQAAMTDEVGARAPIAGGASTK